MKNFDAGHREVGPNDYARSFGYARRNSALVEANTSPVEEVVCADDALAQALTSYYLSNDGLSGFAVRCDGELVGVFSLVKGRGASLGADALYYGAEHLDCFDGYLVGFYEKHGFTVHKRVPNWTPGRPDVVFMSLAESASNA